MPDPVVASGRSSTGGITGWVMAEVENQPQPDTSRTMSEVRARFPERANYGEYARHIPAPAVLEYSLADGY